MENKSIIVQELEKVLREVNEDRYFTKKLKNEEVIQESVNKSIIIEDLGKYNESLISEIIKNNILKKHFTIDVDDIYILQIDKIILLLETESHFMASFTNYINEIRLSHKGNSILENSNVILDFPYKDSILKGGMKKEEVSKNEITKENFYNEVVQAEEIDVLFDKKVLVNSVKYSLNGEKKNSSFSNEDNLILKGNNLIALYTLKERFKGKIDCIYIDPPYNTGTNQSTFAYNNSFNHSSWLVFMKNRLEIAKDLLSKEGVLIIAIDEHEQAYLGVLLNEIFNDREIHMITVVHNPRGVQGTNFSYTNEFLYYIIPKGIKSIGNKKIPEEEIEYSPLRNWGSESLRSDAKNCFYPILVKEGEIIGFGDVSDDDFHPTVNEINDGILHIYPIDTKGVERKWRYARQSVENIKHLLKAEKRSIDDKYDIFLGKDFGQYKTVWIDPKYDANSYGKQYLNKLVEDDSFTFPKSIYAVYDAIHAVVSEKPNSIILDFFAGSGTTGEAIIRLNQDLGGNRKFILVEQMDYIKTITKERIKNYIRENSIDTSFIYTELCENNIKPIKEITNARNIEEIEQIITNYNKMNIFDYNVDIKSLLALFKDEKIDLDNLKELTILSIEKNNLYFNYSEIDDESIRKNIEDTDYMFNKSFYEEDLNAEK